MRKYVVVALLTLFAARSNADTGPQDEWLQLIGKDVGSSCNFELLKVGTVLAGNNGLRSEQWYVKTCKGNLEYQVQYFPPAFFPTRDSPYQVTRITPSKTVSK